jgi:hypothetical protein
VTTASDRHSESHSLPEYRENLRDQVAAMQLPDVL